MRIGIIGAGITGLAATHFIRNAGMDVVTFEAKDRPGGVMWSEESGDAVREFGPQRLRMTPCVTEFVSTFGLEEELRIAEAGLPLFVYRNGELHTVPRSLQAFIRTTALSWRGKARVLREPLSGPVRPDESAASYLRRKFGSECYTAIIEPLLGGIYASDPKEMPATVAIQPLLRLEEQHGSLLRAAVTRLWASSDTPPAISFNNGVEALPQAIAKTYADSIQLQNPVQKLTKANTESGFTIHAETGSTVVDEVIVTTPAPQAAAFLDSIPGAEVEQLRTMTYNPLAIVHLQTNVDLHGFGYQICRNEAFRTRGVTWNSSLFDRDGIVTAFLGGMDDPAICSLPTDEIGAIAREELNAVIGGAANVLNTTILPNAIPAHDQSWVGRTDITIPAGIHLPTNYLGRIGVPGRLRDARRVTSDIIERATN